MISSVKNSSGYTPLILAAKLGRKDMIYEFFITAIQSGLLDLALLILHYSQPDGIPPNALEALATKPEIFPSGNRLGFWGGLIYQWMPIIGIEILEQVTVDEFIEEVETFVEHEHVKALNKDGKTPWMFFTDAHKDLLKEGQQWMNDMATSRTVVAALIVTITFAAAIWVPGGNKDDGKPVFLDERAFILFMISDAIALFSSSTSLLMFLGILTSRYAEIDFLHALPKRFTIGLVSLFLSLAATMIAFGATLALLLHDKVTWIAAPVVLLTSIPVGWFVFLQLPLLYDIVRSTYGPSMFRKQSSRIIY